MQLSARYLLCTVPLGLEVRGAMPPSALLGLGVRGQGLGGGVRGKGGLCPPNQFLGNQPAQGAGMTQA